MQRKAIVCCMTLTQLHSEKEREAIQPNMWIHFTWTAGRRLLLQSQFHSRRMCIQNHIYHLFQSIDNVFQYLYFYQYLLEAFHSEPNSLITKFSSTLSWRKALKYLLKTYIATIFALKTVSSKHSSTYSSNVGDEPHLKAALRIGVIILLSQEPPRTLLSELSRG